MAPNGLKIQTENRTKNPYKILFIERRAKPEINNIKQIEPRMTMTRKRKIWLHLLCWVGAIAALAWGGILANVYWPYVLDSEGIDIFLMLALLILMVTGTYLCLVAIRKAYFGRGMELTRPVLCFRTTAVVLVFILSFLPVCLLLLDFPFCLASGIICVFAGEEIGKGLGLIAIALVSGQIPVAIFVICQYVLKEQ